MVITLYFRWDQAKVMRGSKYGFLQDKVLGECGLFRYSFFQNFLIIRSHKYYSFGC